MRLPLFLLAALAVPGLLMPLRVFEPRYLELMAHLEQAPQAQQRFGIVAIRHGRGDAPDLAGRLYDVGTEVQVRRVVRNEDDTLGVVCTGRRRFRIQGVDAHSDPYLSATVDYLEEAGEDDAAAQAIAHRVRRTLQEFTADLGGPAEDLPASPRMLSYLVLASAPLDFADRQALLEMHDVTERLTEEARLLTRERALSRVLQVLPGGPDWEPGTLN